MIDESHVSAVARRIAAGGPFTTSEAQAVAARVVELEQNLIAAQGEMENVKSSRLFAQLAARKAAKPRRNL